MYYLFSDNYVFPAFEIFLVLVFIYAFLADRLKRGNGIAVKRGAKGRSIIVKISSVIISFFVFQIVDSTETLKEYRIILILVNLFIVAYLCFFNDWFRNKLIGIYIRFEEKIEKH